MECIQNLSQPKHGMALGRGETGAMKVSYVTLASYSYLDARCEEPQNLILPILFPTGRREEYALRRTCSLGYSVSDANLARSNIIEYVVSQKRGHL